MMETKTKISVFSVLTSILALFLFAIFTPTVSAPTDAEKSFPEPKVLGAETEASKELPIFAELKPQQFIAQSPVDSTNVIARSFFVYDIETGQILAEKNADTEVSIASLTKLMTALLTYENFEPEDLITVTSKDLLNITPALHLRVGDTVKVDDVVKAMLIGSANDAASFLGRALTEKTGVPIADLMNQKAGALGMQNSQFQNPIGFDSIRQFSTAYDVHILANAVLRYQDFSDIGHAAQYTFSGDFGNTYRIRATNKLAQRDPSITAIKTGYTDGAQGAMVTKFEHQGHSVAVIVIGSGNREGDSLKLKNAIEQSYALTSTELIK